jgi:exopolysaccharide biosynthesis WecB/TagA/CpsF family protein
MTEQSSERRSTQILGVDVLDLTWEQAFRTVESKFSDDKKQHIFGFLNANNANISVHDKEYRDSLSDVTILPDGFGVDIANMILEGHKFSANLNGTDFIPSLMVYLDKPMTIAMIGGTQNVLEDASRVFGQQTPWHNFVPISDGYINDDKTEIALKKLAKLKPDILLVAMGSPLQEKWVHNYINPEHGKLVFTVGALFDFVSSTMPRAPLSWREWRIEWLYRLLLEPRRLWRRYIVGNPLFIWRIFWHRIFDNHRVHKG